MSAFKTLQIDTLYSPTDHALAIKDATLTKPAIHRKANADRHCGLLTQLELL